MVLLGKEENGMKIFSWITGDLAAIVPPKKRRFLFKCPQSPLPSHSPSFAADNCDIQSTDTYLAAESTISKVSNCKPDMGCAVPRDSSLECKVESFVDREVNLTSSSGDRPSSNGELRLFSFGATASTEFGNGGQQTSDNISAFQPVLGHILENNDSRSSRGDRSWENKFTLSDESAFGIVRGKVELPSPHNRQQGDFLMKQDMPVKQENLNACALEPTLSEQQYSSQSQQTDGELSFVPDNQYSRRFHWDLNTTMHAWEESTDDAPSTHGASGIDNLDLSYLPKRKIEMEPVWMIHQEPSELRLKLGKSELIESCSLKVSNTLKLPSEQCDTNIDLNQKLNKSFGSIVHTDLCTTHATAMLSSHKIFDLSLSIGPPSLAQALNLPVFSAMKTEPVEEDSGEEARNMGVSNSRSVDHSIVKLEPLDGIENEGLNTKYVDDIRSTCGDAVKSGQAVISCLRKVETMEGKACHPESYVNTNGTLHTREMHQDAKGSAARSLNLVNQASIIGFNKEYDTRRTPNAILSKVTEESLSKVPTGVSRLLVCGSKRLDFGQNAPCSAVSSHNAHHNTINLVSEYAISDVDDSQKVLLMPICTNVPQNADKNIVKTTGLAFEPPILVNNEFSQVREMTGGELDSKEQMVASDIPRVGKETSQFVSMYVPNLDSSTGNKRTETAVEGVVEKPETVEPEKELDVSLVAVGVSETVLKQHDNDDHCEDVEVRGSLLHTAVNTCNARPDKNIDMDSVKSIHPVRIPSDAPVKTPSNVAGTESNFENSDELKDAFCTTECESVLCIEKNDAHLYMAKDAKEASLAIGVPTNEFSKNVVLKNSHKLPQESSEDHYETKRICKEIPGSSCSGGAAISNGIVGNQAKGSISSLLPADHSGLFKKGVLHNHDAAKYVRISGWRHIRHLSSLSNAPSAGRKKSIYRRSSSRYGWERRKYISSKGGEGHMKSSRYKRCIDEVYKSGKERKPNQPLRMVALHSRHLRGRDVRQLDTLHGSWDPGDGYASEHDNRSTRFQLSRVENQSGVTLIVGMPDSYEGAWRMGRKHIDDELENLCPPPTIRSSPRERDGSQLVEVQMMRRMKGTSQDNMADSYRPPGARPNYVNQENCLIQRERSRSPVQKRAAPHLPQISLASSPGTQGGSRQLWSPFRRSPAHLGHPEMSRCRSPPPPKVERARLPCGRTYFPQDVLERKHVSLHIPQLHDETRDFETLGEQNVPQPNLHLQENVQQFDLTEHQLNKHYSRHLQSGQICALNGYDAHADEQRNTDEEHGQALSFGQDYVVADSDKIDRSFRHHVGDIPPRPIGLCQDKNGEFPSRDRDICVRNKLGNMHRRVRIMEEQEDGYRHRHGQGWPVARPKNILLQRRKV